MIPHMNEESLAIDLEYHPATIIGSGWIASYVPRINPPTLMLYHTALVICVLMIFLSTFLPRNKVFGTLLT